jgi:lactate dehydrogenase-like 2-hydroxyacid dehydrogenase
MADKVDLLQMLDYPSFTDERLAKLFTIHKPHRAKDAEAFVGGVAARIRAASVSPPAVLRRPLIERLPKLEIISIRAVGVDCVDLDAAAERGIVVTYTPDVLTDCVADLGMGLLVAISRGIVEGDRYARAGRWPSAGDMHLTTALGGKTLGIVGLGRIGKAVARRAEAFGMRIAYQGRHRQDDVDYPYYATPAALAAAVSHLVLCCPGGAATRHMIDAEVLRALGPHGFLVNIARGSVVDEAALVEACRGRTIAGAALDVFEAEPNIPAALFQLENVIVQPHQASATVETRKAMGDLMIDNLVRHFAGQPVLTPVG